MKVLNFNKIYFLIFLLLLFCFPINGQQKMVKDKISLHLYSVPLSEALDILTKQTGYMFSYSSDVIDDGAIISVDAEKDNITDLLNEILPHNLSYKIRGNHIIFHINNNEKVAKLPQPSIDEINIPVENKRDTFIIEKISYPHSGIIISECHKDEILKNTIEMKKQIFAPLSLDAATGNNITSEQQTESQEVYSTNETVESLSSKPKQTSLVKNNLVSFLLGAATLISADTIMAQVDNASNDEKPVLISSSGKTEALQLTFVYPLSTGGTSTARNTYNFSLNVLGGVTGAVDGAEIGSIFNINSFGSKGVQIAGVFNLSGLPKAEIMESDNIQIAGVMNAMRKGYSELQIGGVLNLTDNAKGQIGGIASLSNKSEVQISGIMNVTRKSKSQIAGIINAAQHSYSQIGILNVSSKAGFQIGIVNVADTADFQLGLVNLSKNGMMELELAYDNFWGITGSFRSGKEYFYTILSAGYNPKNEFFMSGTGIGTGIPFGDKFGINIEAVSYQRNNDERYNAVVQLKPSLRYKFNRLQLFAGANLNMSISNSYLFKTYLPDNLFYNRNEKINGWLGYNFGVRYRLF